MIPKELTDFEGIEKCRIDSCYHIYFLYDKEELVYIGQTKSLVGNRVAQHLKDKQFTDCYAIKLPDKEACLMKERELTFKFKPKYNNVKGQMYYPKVGQNMLYQNMSIKVVAIVDDCIIAKSRKCLRPFIIAIEDLQP